MHLFISCTPPAFLSDLQFPDVPSLGGTSRMCVIPFLSTLHFARLNGITTKPKDHLDSLDISIPNGAQKDMHGTDNPGAQVTLKQPGTNPDLWEMFLCKQAMHKYFCAVAKRKHKSYLILLH